MRLQGFPDDHADFGINEKGETYAISDTGKYQCAGNAVTVNVIEAIVTAMLREGCLR
jgi:site-specific DNA-cytosine methylase